MGEKQPSKWKEILLKILYWVGEILTVFIAGLSVLLALSVRWMFATWTNLSMDELVYHLTAPLDGTNTDMIWDYVRVCAVPTIDFLPYFDPDSMEKKRKSTSVQRNHQPGRTGRDYCDVGIYLDRTGSRRLSERSEYRIKVY